MRSRPNILPIILEQEESADDLHLPAIQPRYLLRNRTPIIQVAVHPATQVVTTVYVAVGDLIDVDDADLHLIDDKNAKALIDLPTCSLSDVDNDP